jgi:hypothetical protein
MWSIVARDATRPSWTSEAIVDEDYSLIIAIQVKGR